METAVEKRSWKRIVRFQRFFCIILIGVMLVVSFLGMYRVPFDEDCRRFYEPFSEEEIADGAKEGRYVSFHFVSSVVSVVYIPWLAELRASEMSAVYYEVLEDVDVTPMDDAKGIAYLLIGAWEEGFVVLVYYLLLMLFSISAPIFFLVLLIVALKKYRVPSIYRKEHALYKGVMNLFRTVLISSSIWLLVAAMAPRGRLGLGLLILLILVGVGILVHMVAAWQKEYTSAQKKYLAVLQITSIVGLSIGLFFCFAMRRANLVLRVVECMLGTRSVSDTFAFFRGGSFSFTGEILLLFLGVLFFAAFFFVYRSLANNLCRISLATTKMKKEDRSKGDAYIASTVFPNVMILIYVFLFDTSLELVFYEEELLYFWLAMISVVAMTLIEIAVLVLRSTVCAELGEGGRDTVLEGSTYTAKTEAYDVDEVKNYERAD